MRNAVLAFAALLASSALCSANPAAPSMDLENVHLSDLRVPDTALRRIDGVPQDRISQLFLLPEGGNNALFGMANGPSEFTQAVIMWSGILERAGLRPGKPSFEDGTYTIPYEGRDGLVLRRFIADPKQFKPKDEASLRANRDSILAALQREGVVVVASYVVDDPDLLPTYSIYYLTKKDASEELGLAESRLRILKRGEDIDFDILQNAGIKILQKPQPWLMVYYGRAVSFVSGLATTREGAEKLLADRLQYFAEQHKTVIGSRIHELEPDPTSEYRFLVNVYLYP